MFRKLCDRLSGGKWTIASGVFLAISLILMLTHTHVAFDPAWLTVAISGYPLVYLAVTRLVEQKWISSCLLISIAMLASLLIGELFAAGEVAWIMAVGALLEDMTVERARKGISELVKLRPEKARRVKADGSEEIILASEIRKGDTLRIKPGEQIPADGIVKTGHSTVDQSIMTGESLPVEKEEGSELWCGTMNTCGSVDMETTAYGKDSSFSKLIEMVKAADEKKAPMQRIADRWSVWLVPIALAIAIIGSAVSYWGLHLPLMDALERGVTVLVVFCPCALALATPTSIIAAIGQAAKHGVIIKGGDALEAMGKVDTVCFDKTGTITEGRLEVEDIAVFSDELDEEELLILAASAEKKSEHPLALSIVSRAEETGKKLSEAESFEMDPGRGVKATVDGRRITLGNERWMNDNGIALNANEKETLDSYTEEGKATILVALEGELVGIIALSDVLRKDAKKAIDRFREMDVKTVLLTGDNERAAQHFAKRVGIDEVKSDLLPEDKVSAVESLMKEGRLVSMIGDGVNDAPALKTSNVGVAMGSMGSDIALEAADIALMRDDLKEAVYLKRLSRSCIRTIKFNITLSMCINAVAVTLSVLGLLDPVTGALVHNAGSALVVLNAALLYDRKFDEK